MPAPAIIHQLVAKFEENRAAYRSGKYNEARLRQEFLDPFFAALGWDVYNEKGVAPEYADVIIEDSLSFEGSSRAPDYAFKIGRERKFYVEAKKPAVDIQYDIHPAYQLRRYAWNAHLPLSILTDFEDFAVYNCKAKPNPTDSSATSREMLIHFTDYVARWDEIAAIFSRDAVWKGALERYAETSKGKKGTTEVDDEFLKDMNEWRVTLARNIALRNTQIADEHQLNYAVQMTIDRVIFLRICEDRGIEPEEQLKTIAASPNIYASLLELFKRADLRYNSGLFHFNAEKGNTNHPDTFTPTLKIDDRVLKEIIHSIYYPCPYIFKEIPVEILGQVYEQFLGQVIRLTAGHQAKVEEKPEVRKAGGVYYTPRYIVDYIVANTVGKLLEGKTPEQAASLKIVDPACGSGSFLLGAFQYLIDWHEQWYLANDPQKWTRGKAPALNEVINGYRLTTLKKKEILLNNLHGVDIDPQAVEVTKLSLLLKVLEEESGQLSLGLERALPDLGRNIQCGNSLIGEDYFAGQLAVDPAERRRVNPFDWREAFPDVFSQGGFDAVIGNPPYVRSNNMDEKEKIYWKKTRRFSIVTGKFDIYLLFIENAIATLKPTGYLSFIIPYPILSQSYASLVRKLILNKCVIYKIVDLSKLNVFSAKVSTCILVLMQEKERSLRLSNKISIFQAEDSFLNKKTWTIGQSVFENTLENMFRLNINDENERILGKVWKKGRPFSDYCYIGIGMDVHDSKTGLDKSARLLTEKKDKRSKPYVEGKEISRYSKPRWSRFIDYVPQKMHRPKYPEMFETSKILVQVVVGREGIIATLDEDWIYAEQTLSLCVPKHVLALTGKKDTEATHDQIELSKNHDIKYLLGLLCGRLINWYFKIWLSDELHVVPENLRQLPIREIDFNNPDDSQKYNQILSLVDQMLDLHKQTPATPQEHEQLQRQIAATDRQNDALVYQLYGLTAAEIALVEGSS